jgi:hypothetical protein
MRAAASEILRQMTCMYEVFTTGSSIILKLSRTLSTVNADLILHESGV